MILVFSLDMIGDYIFGGATGWVFEHNREPDKVIKVMKAFPRVGSKVLDAFQYHTYLQDRHPATYNPYHNSYDYEFSVSMLWRPMSAKMIMYLFDETMGAHKSGMNIPSGLPKIYDTQNIELTLQDAKDIQSKIISSGILGLKNETSFKDNFLSVRGPGHRNTYICVMEKLNVLSKSKGLQINSKRPRAEVFKEVANFLWDDLGMVTRDTVTAGNYGFRANGELVIFDPIIAPLPEVNDWKSSDVFDRLRYNYFGYLFTEEPFPIDKVKEAGYVNRKIRKIERQISGNTFDTVERKAESFEVEGFPGSVQDGTQLEDWSVQDLMYSNAVTGNFLEDQAKFNYGLNAEWESTELMVGKKGEIAWRAINPPEYAMGLELGYLPVDRTMMEGHYAIMGNTPASFQINWKGYPMFEIDMEGLAYIKSSNKQWDQPGFDNIAITQDIPIGQVLPYDSDLGMWDKGEIMPRRVERNNHEWQNRFDGVTNRPGFWEYDAEMIPQRYRPQPKMPYEVYTRLPNGGETIIYTNYDFKQAFTTMCIMIRTNQVIYEIGIYGQKLKDPHFKDLVVRYKYGEFSGNDKDAVAYAINNCKEGYPKSFEALGSLFSSEDFVEEMYVKRGSVYDEKYNVGPSGDYKEKPSSRHSTGGNMDAETPMTINMSYLNYHMPWKTKANRDSLGAESNYVDYDNWHEDRETMDEEKWKLYKQQGGKTPITNKTSKRDLKLLNDTMEKLGIDYEPKKYVIDNPTMAYRAMPFTDYAKALEIGYLYPPKQGIFASLNPTPTKAQASWKGYPVFEIDITGLNVTFKSKQGDEQGRIITIDEPISVDRILHYGKNSYEGWKAESHPKCPICFGYIPNNQTPGRYPGALARYDNKTEICSECGSAEAMAGMFGTPEIIEEWEDSDKTFDDYRILIMNVKNNIPDVVFGRGPEWEQLKKLNKNSEENNNKLIRNLPSAYERLSLEQRPVDWKTVPVAINLSGHLGPSEYPSQDESSGFIVPRKDPFTDFRGEEREFNAWYDLATDRQRNYIKRLGGDPHPDLNRRQASKLINQLAREKKALDQIDIIAEDE